jgi:hypothetical protein
MDVIIARLAMVRDSRISRIGHAIQKTPTSRRAKCEPRVHILEGSSANGPQGRAGPNAQSVGTDDDTHLWAQNYERDLEAISRASGDRVPDRAGAAGNYRRRRPRRHDSAPTEASTRGTAYLRAAAIDAADDPADFASDGTFSNAIARFDVISLTRRARRAPYVSSRVDCTSTPGDRAPTVARVRDDSNSRNIAEAPPFCWGFHKYDDALASLARAKCEADADIHPTTA